jgi:2-polyprenyl-3-methyl-5-hydroxy-6-metoxy-1,4-benzoquinol methylase
MTGGGGVSALVPILERQMTKPGTGLPQWEMVDQGWGRKVVDFATLSEPSNCREYVTMHHRLGVDAGDRLLDVACGSGLALELARLRGASCSGIDASPRLVAVARDRNPECDIRVGDMHALPWDPASFDVVTSFRGSGAPRPTRWPRYIESFARADASG